MKELRSSIRKGIGKAEKLNPRKGRIEKDKSYQKEGRKRGRDSSRRGLRGWRCHTFAEVSQITGGGNRDEDKRGIAKRKKIFPYKKKALGVRI